ncbi:MAG: hypothetical protein PHO49_01885 [Candidatus Nanoarchaeia archaeon]|nr:hypothetical protein [Candidatus Nanoarchaeia archaeon]
MSEIYIPAELTDPKAREYYRSRMEEYNTKYASRSRMPMMLRPLDAPARMAEKKEILRFALALQKGLGLEGKVK